MADAPPKTPLSELAEALAALKASPPDWQQEKSGPDHQPEWRVRLTLSLPGGPARTFASGAFTSVSEAKSDAALRALNECVRDAVQRLPKRSGPVPALTCVALLYDFCHKQDVEITGGEIQQRQLYGWKGILRWPSGETKEDWYCARAEFASKAAAKKEAALCAIDHFLAHPKYGPMLLPLTRSLPVSEQRGAAPSLAPRSPALPPLRSPQVRGQAFYAADGTMLTRETRHLEFKGVDETVREEQRWKGMLQSWLTGSKTGFEEKHVSVYVSAFLNAGVNGRIVLGVSDAGIVQGVAMSANDLDQLSKTWAQRLNLIWPHVPHHSGLVSEPLLIPVIDPSGVHANLFLIVFEVTPQPGPHFPYFWDKARCRAHKKVENTISPITAEELTQMIITAHQNGATP